ncbi:MAG: acetyltransferase [Synergistaceae bacterium]|jgi:sugar O-acyltransferase (sialic acid O-acetyltransferase NeuD family)|nr:acetyltransferase [Synergistaceae bacterium]
MRKIIVCGAGGAGREVIDMIESMNGDSRWEIIGFSDAEWFNGQKVNGYPVMSEGDLLNFPEQIDAVISVGSPAAREKIFEKFKKNPNVSFPPIVHPSSHVARGAVLSEGVLITGFCSVSPNTTLGKGVFLNGYCVVGHDTKIGDFSSLMSFSMIAGNVNMGKRILSGAGSVVVQGLNIGDDVLLCAGSVVVRDVKESAKMMGNPARSI